MNRGSLALFKKYFEVFSNPQVLDLLGPIPLFIKFIPSLGVKTKKLAGVVTNISDENTSNLVNIGKDLSKEIKPSLTEVWKALDRYISKRLD